MNKGRESVVFFFFFCFQILLSHHNNHLAALCGLAAATDVEGEREREGGGKLMRLDSDQSRRVQRSTLVDLPPLLPALPYRSVTDCAQSQIYRKARSIQIRSNAKLSDMSIEIDRKARSIQIYHKSKSI